MPDTSASPAPTFDLSYFRSAYFENCTSYSYPSFRKWPSEILHGYGPQVFGLPLCAALQAHLIMCFPVALTLGKKPYTRRRPAPAANPPRTRRTLAAVYDQKTALREIVQCATTSTQTLSIATEWCSELNIWKPRPPTVVFALVAYSLIYLIERYEVDVVGRLPKTLWTDKDEPDRADAVATPGSAILEESSSREEVVHAETD